jgi:hypothetical protein
MKYIRFFQDENISLVVAEPLKNHYVWLSLYLHKNLRNGVISPELIKYFLFIMKGTHHIHWMKGISTFKKLSIELNWQTKNKSEIFYKCNYSIAKEISKPPYLEPLFKILIKRQIFSECPDLKTYHSKKDQRIVIERIKNQFDSNKIRVC